MFKGKQLTLWETSICHKTTETSQTKCLSSPSFHFHIQFSNFGEVGSMALFYSKECVKPLHKVLLIQDKSDLESVRWKSAIRANPGVLKEREPLRKHLLNTLSSANINTQNALPSLKICPLNTRIYSHLRRASPPALVSHAEAAKALSLGHLVLPCALVLPTGH